MMPEAALGEGIEILEQFRIPGAADAAQALLDGAENHADYIRALREHIRGTPIAYITGRMRFADFEIQVDRTVMIPRPASELIFHRAAAIGKTLPGRFAMADCCTGCGCIALGLARAFPGVGVTALDISAACLRSAAANTRRLSLDADVRLAQADLLTCLPDASLDLLAANPPSSKREKLEEEQRRGQLNEPLVSLLAGDDGLAILRRLVPEAARVVRPGGWAVFELA